MASSNPGRLPPQIAYIIGNEGCERFSFYGMRNILTEFLKTSMFLYIVVEADREIAAKEVFHTFVIGVYFFPLLGGWIADTFAGKARTILWLSLVYALGHLTLALCETWEPGFYAGLFLIAVGSGGIKPCVSAFVGDQFDQSNKHLARFVFDAFYWIINFGSFFASLLMPPTLKYLGPAVAFGIPGILMCIATLVFIAGRKRYVLVPPKPSDPDSFVRVAATALFSGPLGIVAFVVSIAFTLGALALMPYLGFVKAVCLAMVVFLFLAGVGTALTLDKARSKHPEEAVEGVRSVLRILVLFALVTPFFSLFDQKASTWVLQADHMSKPWWFVSSQMQALNPALVMILIPLTNVAWVGLRTFFGIEATSLRRMTLGIGIAGLSWIVVGVFQLLLDRSFTLSIAWQVLPYAILTLAEVLVSATGLEFAYSQAPARMKGAIMAFWSLTTTIGNLWVLLVDAGVRNQVVENALNQTGLGATAFQMFFFAGFAVVAAVIFGIVAYFYPLKEHYRATA